MLQSFQYCVFLTIDPEVDEIRPRRQSGKILYSAATTYISSLAVSHMNKKQSRSRKRSHSPDTRTVGHSPPKKSKSSKSKRKKPKRTSSKYELSEDDRRHERFLDRLCDPKYKLPMRPPNENVLYIKFIALDNGSHVGKSRRAPPSAV